MVEENCAIEALHDANWLTGQNQGCLDSLTPTQSKKFSEILQLLVESQRLLSLSGHREVSTSLHKWKKLPIQVVFRGDNLVNLSRKLRVGTDQPDEFLLMGRLFYFGEKARHFYCVGENDYGNRRWIASIEDHSIRSARVIFQKIRAILKKRSEVVELFKASNLEFTNFFLTGTNVDFFSQNLVRFRHLREYYLFFLHTAGKIGIGDASLLVSTSRSYEVAKKFSGNFEDRYIIYYLIPSPFNAHSISPSRRSNAISSLGLPEYRGKTLYPDQHEVAIKGALFPHHMLGVMIERKDRTNDFVVNPHIFHCANSIEAIFKGLRIDQSGFERGLNDTGYKRGVELGWNAEYSTIVRKAPAP